MHLSSPSSFLNSSEIFLIIRNAVMEHSPFSFIRMGDGEGLLLSLGEQSWIKDIEYFGKHFGPDEVSYANLMRLRDDLRDAFNKTNLIGIRDDVLGYSIDPNILNGPLEILERNVKTHFPLRSVESNLPANGCRRLACANLVLAELDELPTRNLTSAWSHWDFVLSGDLYRLLQTQDRIGLITCRSNLAPLIESLFPLKVVEYQVPEKFHNAKVKVSGANYPQRFNQLYSELRVDYPGMLFLVGAGICGKVYCQWIKERGGVALDMGAVLDSWVGLASRPAVMIHKFPEENVPGEVPADLLLNRHTIDRLLNKCKASRS